MNHTSLPWARHTTVRIKHYPGTLRKSDILGPPHPVDGGDYAPLFSADKDVAEMAFKCINNHQKLVDALRDLEAIATEATKAQTAGQEQVALMRLIGPASSARTLLTELEQK